MTVKELAEKLKKCKDDSEVLIVEIDDYELEIHHAIGCAVADTGEALISMKRRERGSDGKENEP